MRNERGDPVFNQLTPTRMAAAPTDGGGAPAPTGEAIEALFAALEAPLLTYALRLLADATAAEDVVQEAFMRLHTHIAEVREPRGWLYRTVHNLALNHQRQRRKLVPLTAPEAGGEEPGPGDLPDPQLLPDEAIARWEGIGLVRLGIAALEPRQRLLVELKFRENLSYQEISDRTGLSVGNVGYLLHHTLKSLAAELAKAGLVP